MINPAIGFAVAIPKSVKRHNSNVSVLKVGGIPFVGSQVVSGLYACYVPVGVCFVVTCVLDDGCSSIFACGSTGCPKWLLRSG